jgi:outer membrane protein TolC
MRQLGLALVIALPVGLSAGLARADELRIEDAVALALARNEVAKISDANVVVADAAVLKARTAFYPTIGVLGTYTQSPQDVVAPGHNSYSLLASAVFTQPILNASSFPLYAQSKRLYDGQVAQTVDDKRLLAYDAVRAFFAALTADAVAAAAADRLKTAQLNVDDTQARLDARLVSSNDVTRAKIDLGNAVNELETDRGTAQVTYQALAFTINAPVPTKLAPPTALLGAGRADVPGVENLLRTAIAKRPDLVSKRFLAVAAHDFADEPMLRLVPSLALSGTFTLTSNPTYAGADIYNNEFLLFTVTWPLFDAGVRYADKRSRDAQANIADLTVDALVRTVDAQVRSAVFTLKSAQAALVGAEQARDAANLSKDETAILYKQGLAKAIELVDANDSAFLAAVNYATAEYGLTLAYLNLRQTIGLDPLGTELR